MKFKRLDDVTVRCIITEEDMIEHNVNIDDFLNSKEKTHDFLHKIVEQATIEVGFKPSKGMLSMQVMALPKNGLAITFSESSKEDIENVLEHFGNIVKDLGDSVPDELVESLKEMSKDKKMEVIDKFMKGLIQDAVGEYEEEQYLKQSKDQKHKKRQEPQKEFSNLQIYLFESLEHIEKFSKMIPKDIAVVSSLYKSKGNQYYLVLGKGLLSDRDYENICNLVIEYGRLESNEIVRMAYLKEHEKCIIKTNAIQILGNL